MKRKRTEKKLNGTRRKRNRSGSKQGKDIDCNTTPMAVPIFTEEGVVWNSKFGIKNISEFRNANDVGRVSRTKEDNVIKFGKKNAGIEKEY